jgi:glycosyltransferase involved in cell wall biosynthesis
VGLGGRKIVRGKVKILVVLVLYRVDLCESVTYKSLTKLWAEDRPKCDVELLVYDNSERPIPVSVPKGLPYRYINNSTNGGLVTAYNTALNMAKETGAKWILLLDQDTQLPPGYLARQSLTIGATSADPSIVAVVPRVTSSGKRISPAWVRSGWRLEPVPATFSGILSEAFTAINSGAALNVEFVSGIGGFDERFKIDYLDHWLFRIIATTGRKIFVTDETLQHDLSVTDIGKKVNLVRYNSILTGEFRFFRNFGSRTEYAAYLVRLIARYVRQAAINDTRKHAKMTFSYFLRALRGSLADV